MLGILRPYLLTPVWTFAILETVGSPRHSNALAAVPTTNVHPPIGHPAVEVRRAFHLQTIMKALSSTANSRAPKEEGDSLCCASTFLLGFLLSSF